MKTVIRLTYVIFAANFIKVSEADWLDNIIALREGRYTANLSAKALEKLDKKIERKLQKLNAHQTFELETRSKNLGSSTAWFI